MILACSDQAPGVVVTESMQRLNHLMAGSELKSLAGRWWLHGLVMEVFGMVVVMVDGDAGPTLWDQQFGGDGRL